MKFLILNGPNVNLQRYSEPGMPGELDYNGMMDYCSPAATRWALRPTYARPTTRAT